MRLEIRLTTNDGENLISQVSPTFEPHDFTDFLDDARDDLVERLLQDGLSTL